MKNSTVKRVVNLILVSMLVFMSYAASFAMDVSAENDVVAEDLFISEYVEGSSFNKAIEIYNGTGDEVDLSGYQVALYSNGATEASQTVHLSGTIAHGDVFVIAHKSAASEILNVTDLQHSAVVNFNGDDAFVLKKDQHIIDVLGVIGDDSEYGKDVTLVRQSSVREPSVSYDESQWIDYAKDTFAYLGSHTMDGVDPTEPPTEPGEPGADYTIGDARILADGTAVSVEGIATVDNAAISIGAQFTTYLQDETGGINLFAYEQGKLPDLEKGDRVKVSGKLDSYNGLKEIVPSTIEVVDKGQPLPEVQQLTLADLQDPTIAEEYEGELVQVKAFINNIPPEPAGGGYNVSMIDADFNGTTLRVMENALDLSLVESARWYDVTAIVSQYNDYQLIPTAQNDIQLLDEQPEPPSAEGVYLSTVKSVVDGDTIHLETPVLGGTKVRFLNMDTAETYTAHNKDPERVAINQNQLFYGELAKEYINGLLEPGDEVLVKIGQEPTDDYGRLLAEIIRKDDGLNINLEMVKQGLAVTYFIAPFDQTVYPDYQNAVKEAKDQGLGIWNEENPLLELPFEFRANDDKKGFSKYVGNSDTMKYVEPNDWPEIPVENRVFFWDEQTAQDYGYTPIGEGGEQPVVEVTPKKNNGTATVHMRDLQKLDHGVHVLINIYNKKKPRNLLLNKKQVDMLKEKEITLTVTNGTVSKTFEMIDVREKVLKVSLEN